MLHKRLCFCVLGI